MQKARSCRVGRLVLACLLGMIFSSPINADPCLSRQDGMLPHQESSTILATISKSPDSTQYRTTKTDNTLSADHLQLHGLSSDSDRINRHFNSKWIAGSSETDPVSASYFSCLHQRAPPSLKTSNAATRLNMFQGGSHGHRQYYCISFDSRRDRSARCSQFAIPS